MHRIDRMMLKSARLSIKTIGIEIASFHIKSSWSASRYILCPWVHVVHAKHMLSEWLEDHIWTLPRSSAFTLRIHCFLEAWNWSSVFKMYDCICYNIGCNKPYNTGLSLDVLWVSSGMLVTWRTPRWHIHLEAAADHLSSKEITMNVGENHVSITDSASKSIKFP